MSAELRISVAATTGVLLLKLVTGGGYRAYVRPRMGPLLLIAAVALLGAALLFALPLLRKDGHDKAVTAHRHGSRVELLFLGPLVLLATVPPAPLGAAAASMRSGSYQARSISLFPSLTPGKDGTVELTVSDFVGRALFDDDRSLEGVRVKLVGFVAPDPSAAANGFELVRLAIFCCAADAVPMGVHVRKPGLRAPPSDTWVEAIGMWRPAPPLPAGTYDPKVMPTLDASSVRLVPEPSDPYDPPL